MSKYIQVEFNIYEYAIQKAQVISKTSDKFTVAMPITKDQYHSLFTRIPSQMNGFKFRNIRIIGKGDPFDFEDVDEEYALSQMIKEKNTIPHDFDFNTRRFTLKSTSDNKSAYISWKECDRMTYYKYCISLIGNPEHVLIFTIYKDDYYDSDYYKELKASYGNT